MVAPLGLEPRLDAPEASVLPLHNRAKTLRDPGELLKKSLLSGEPRLDAPEASVLPLHNGATSFKAS